MAFGQKMRSNLQRHRVWKVSILQLFEMFVSLSKIQNDIYEDPITLADPEFGVIADLCWSPDVSQWSIYFCSVAFELWHPFIFHSKLLAGGGGGWKRYWLRRHDVYKQIQIHTLHASHNHLADIFDFEQIQNIWLKDVLSTWKLYVRNCSKCLQATYGRIGTV